MIDKITAKLIRAKLIRVRAGRLEGYAFNPAKPYERCELTVMVNGENIATAICTHQYDGIGDDYHGFVIALPECYYNGGKHIVDLIIDGYSITGYPITATFCAPAPIMIAAPSPPLRLHGAIDGLHFGVLSGWCFNPNCHDDLLNIELHIDDNLIANACNDIYRADLLHLGSGNYGFRITIPEELLDDGTHHVKIIATSSRLNDNSHDNPNNSANPNNSDYASLEIAQTIIFPQLTDCYDGRVDLAQHPRVQGWAWNMRSPDEILELQVFLAGELLGNVQACEMRQDLARAGVGKGDKAFNYMLPTSLDPSKEYEIEVRFAANGKSLRRSPLPLVFSNAATNFNQYILHNEAINDADTTEKWQNCPQINVERAMWQLHALEHARPICVIIPIYNAYDEVQQCVTSLLANCKLADKIILINDASTDERIFEFLHELDLAGGLDNPLHPCETEILQRNDPLHPCGGGLGWGVKPMREVKSANEIASEAKIKTKLQIIHNPKNLGYTATVNKAMAECANHDVALLNSDTRVTPNWLEQLQLTAYMSANIGTVTAISNNAGAFSVPELGDVGNQTPSNFNDAEIGRLIRQNSLRLYPNTPTANGFCLFIKRELLNQIGDFNADLFPRGYGEENEFSMRSRNAGWQHKVDDACFIFHQRSASFGDEKAILIENANNVLRKRYPEYSKLAADFCVSPAMQQVRRHVRLLYQNARTPKPSILPKPRIIYVLHGNATGGTPYTTRDLMNNLASKWDIFLAECDRSTITLKRMINGELQLMGEWKLQTPLSIADQFRPDYAAIMLYLLQTYAIELVHIRHLHKHSLDLPRIANALHIPVILSFHDFYFVCPTINLLDEKQKFCGGVCTKTKITQNNGKANEADTQATSDCALPYPLEESIPPLKHRFIHRWQEEISRIFPYISGFVTTSHFARDIMVKTYPTLANEDFRVIEHGRDFAQQQYLAVAPSLNAPLKIIIAGQMTKHKGADFIEKLLKLDTDNGAIEFHFLGNLPEKYSHLGVFHGSYSRDELPAKVAEIGGNVMGIFSIWAETYCHVLSEAWACGMPVIASNLGALKERINIHGGGWVIDIAKPKSAYTKICAIRANENDYQRKVAAASLQALRNINEMSDDYADFYADVMR